MKYNKNIPLLSKYDLVVCGGGPAGCAAALSARRAGLSVLLIEQTGQLGGVGTSCGVTIWLGGHSVSCERDVLGPLRVMAPCMAMGEAAGLAAHQVIENDVSFAYVNIGSLRAGLRKAGAIIEL